MLYRISHRTTYNYANPVSVGDHVAENVPLVRIVADA